WAGGVVGATNPTGGQLSSFTSYGLAADLSFKPDLGAPGGSIYSTYPLELGGYASLSGTSMASPHVAGSVALLLEALPRPPPPGAMTLLQNTAVPVISAMNAGIPDVVHRQGAGLIRIDSAATTVFSVSPSAIALGESETGPSMRTITVHNTG